MTFKPTTTLGYQGSQTSLVRATCLYIATKLGDIMDDLVIVGGLVPSLLIDQEALPSGVEAHVGTMDLDLGLSVLLLNEERYRSLTARLRSAGFEQDVNEAGNPTRQRWVIEKPARVTVDFLIAPTRPGDRGGKLRDIEPDFAALIAPGLQLAFEDQVKVTLGGTTLLGEKAKRNVRVCGPGAYLVLKSFALRLRGENKDAYDLYYVLRNYGSGPSELALRFQSLLHDTTAQQALGYLREDFEHEDSIGPSRAAEFLLKGEGDEIRADAVAFARAFLSEIAK